jgi:hypothetical protein
MFFLGGSVLVPVTESDVQKLQVAREQIASFDVNEEYENILGPLRDIYIQSFFEEFIWRLDAKLEPRITSIPDTDITVSEFNFKNYKRLSETDSKITKYFDTEHFLNRMMEEIGKELTTNDYDLRDSFKAGVCFFNLKAQVDPKCATEILRVINGSLPPIVDFITMVGRTPKEVFDGYLDIQIPLHVSIRNHSQDFCEILWGFQSFIFFKDQKEIVGISDLSIEDFKEHCRNTTLQYLSVAKREPLIKIAEKMEHLTMFPSIQLGADERKPFVKAFSDAFGEIKTEGYHGDAHVKCLLIYSFFNVICETVLSSTEKVTIQ